MKIKDTAILLLGSAILAFGLYNVHSISNVTEGGALGLMLLIEHGFRFLNLMTRQTKFLKKWRMLM